LRNAEDRVKELAEEKMQLQEQLADIKNSIDRINKDNQEQRNEIRGETHNIEITTIDLEKLRKELADYNKENQQLLNENEKISKNIPELKQTIEDLRQKIQLNEILKEIDLDELKMLKQNNITVNNSIANLISRWESLEANS
jgi:chromosome segregation ATPase